ncbi:hypothetical protein [Chitinophaga deserti]|uniref:hypothetical protein n=1 Tax=Chitinophaga deserti TaxID=2164099 RepID=UPI000D6CABA9|nr:hypothetical protein [Chitinophaga deserti]
MMLKGILKSSFILALPLLAACGATSPESTVRPGWQQQFAEELPLLGHRNWIIVADKAFPELKAEGITYINTGSRLLPVLKDVLAGVGASGHVKPILYRDQELNYISESQSAGITAFRDSATAMLKGNNIREMLHDSVFAKLDAAAGMFRVVVLKTDEQLPYTSVLLELDCAYWNAEKEAALRKAMAAK